MTTPDDVDRIIEQWRRERPDLDLDAMATFGRLGRLYGLLGRAVDATFAAHGLQRGEYDVLAALRRAGAPYELIPSALADTLMLSRAGMTNRLDRLEEAGLVERRANRDDRRSLRVALTPEGLRLVDAVTTEHVANESRLLAALTPAERAALDGIARKLLDSLG
ncbi:MarR family winged helix-turn-helix transcriptional regulator [Dactylosporangium sp. CA-052675]|uniref:MarR family winged helix-turn-helix transcriptional regulator n=1 Tax=Dactylosporangium sp. CA-052675 TaxID=3239927 RepID=UPI003D8E3711